LDDLEPDLVLRGAVQGQVRQAGVAGGADAVLASGPTAVAEFEVGELTTGGVSGEAGEPVAVGVGESQGWGRSARTRSRIS